MGGGKSLAIGLGAAAVTGGGMYMYMKKKQKKDKRKREKYYENKKNKEKHSRIDNSDSIHYRQGLKSDKQKCKNPMQEIRHIHKKPGNSSVYIRDNCHHEIQSSSKNQHQSNFEYSEQHPESLFKFTKLVENREIQKENSKYGKINSAICEVLCFDKMQCMLFNKELNNCIHQQKVSIEAFSRIFKRVCNVSYDLAPSFIGQLFSQNSTTQYNQYISCKQARILFKCLKKKVDEFVRADVDSNCTIDASELMNCFNYLDYNLSEDIFRTYCSQRNPAGHLNLEQFIDFSIKLDTYTGFYESVDQKSIGKIFLSVEDLFYVFNLM